MCFSVIKSSMKPGRDQYSLILFVLNNFILLHVGKAEASEGNWFYGESFYCKQFFSCCKWFSETAPSATTKKSANMEN